MTAEIEVRTHAQPLYPGSFYPTEGGWVQVSSDKIDDVLAVFPLDATWFCVEVTTRPWRRWTSGEREQWLPEKGVTPDTYRIYVGEIMTLPEIEALGTEYRILASNMRGNDWPRVVKTRRGNFQPIADRDIVLAEQPVRL